MNEGTFDFQNDESEELGPPLARWNHISSWQSEQSIQFEYEGNLEE